MISRYIHPPVIPACWCGHSVISHGYDVCSKCAADGLTSLAEHGARVIE